MYIDVTGSVSVDNVYDAMTEGDRIHMVNKLHKHGYIGSHKLDGSIGEQSLKRIVDDLKAYVPLSTIAKMYED